MGVVISLINRQTGAMASTGLIGGGVGDLAYPTGTSPSDAGICLDNYLKSKRPSSPLVGQGKIIAEAGQRTNINPAFLLAIAGQESSFGTVNGGNPNKENYFNTKCSSNMQGTCVGGYQHFPSIEVAINEHANLLNRVYFSQGLNTIEAIANKYCPPSDSPLCPEWPGNVTKIFNEITQACPSLIVSAANTSGQCGEKIVAIAQKEVGYKEGPNNSNKYSDINGTAGWCAVFSSWVYKQAGYLNVLDAGPVSLVEDHPRYLTKDTPNGDANKIKPGDIFWMSSSESASGTHSGIVKSVNGNEVNTIEGNVSDSVGERKRDISQIKEVARPLQCQ